MRIAVGSTNPVKLAAAEMAARPLWPQGEFLAVPVESGVGDQPWGDEETIRGAIRRAQGALARGRADVGIGIEAGVHDTSYGLFVISWAAVVDRAGRLGLGGGGRLLLPEPVARRVRQGQELGPVMDAWTGEHNTKQRQGTVGILTGGRFGRTEALAHTCLLALARFIAADHYERAPAPDGDGAEAHP